VRRRVATPEAQHALRASIEMQRRLGGGSSDEPPLPLAAGVGLDMGKVVPTEGGYRGAALNVAVRLCSIAGRGQSPALG
jgi:class 3 adenylate cyclase